MSDSSLIPLSKNSAPPFESPAPLPASVMAIPLPLPSGQWKCAETTDEGLLVPTASGTQESEPIKTLVAEAVMMPFVKESCTSKMFWDCPEAPRKMNWLVEEAAVA